MSRDNTWLKISVTYTRDAFAAATRVRTWKSSIRWIVKYFLPEIRRMSAHNAKASSLIGKILQQRAIDEKDASYEKPRDALQGVQDALPEKKRGDIQMHTDMSLGLIAAAIHTTSALCTNVIFDLAFRPEYIELLREEATEVLKESNGHWTSESMKKLKKLDSFIKESQRHTAASCTLLILSGRHLARLRGLRIQAKY
jgi:cytochrome P450